MKVFAVISCNEYASSVAGTIQVHGVFLSYAKADKHADKIQKKLDKNPGYGNQVWVETTELAEETED